MEISTGVRVMDVRTEVYNRHEGRIVRIGENLVKMHAPGVEVRQFFWRRFNSDNAAFLS